ncbi:MAG: BrnT family toxin [Nitrospinae bacterium]|nr:BrnT family toxin [Nitrospinota bacterium]
MMEFEFDREKSEANKAKHGIDFDEARALWNDPDFVEIPARLMDEPRFVIIGKIEGKLWSAVITYRSGNIRLISARRARKEEMEIYESL